MRRSLTAITSIVLLAALALSGCGTSAPAVPKTTNITFASPAVKGTSISALYTCDGRNISPPLIWGEVPAGTKELAVFMLGLTPTTAREASVSVEWAIAGINPALHRLPAGKLPAGIHVGRDTGGRSGYSLCPARGKSKTYQFGIYAVPASITIPGGFVGLQVLGKIANINSSTTATAGGQFVVTYKRRAA